MEKLKKLFKLEIQYFKLVFYSRVEAGSVGAGAALRHGSVSTKILHLAASATLDVMLEILATFLPNAFDELV
jgi:hypothetical protein